MESLLIKGGVPLRGEVQIAAPRTQSSHSRRTLLTDEPCVIRMRPT